MAGKESGNDILARKLEEDRQTIASAQSPEMQQQRSNIDAAKGFKDTMVALWDNPRAVANFVGEQLPQFGLMGKVGKAAMAGKTGVEAVVAATTANQILSGVMSAADAGTSAEQAMYAYVKQQGGSEQEARDKASAARSVAGAVGGVLGTAIGRIGASAESGILARALGHGAEKLTVKQAAQKVPTLIAKEFTEESLDEGLASQMASNLGEMAAGNKQRGVMDDVAKSAAIGGTLGLVMGGGMGAVDTLGSISRQPVSPQVEQSPQAAPQSPQDHPTDQVAESIVRDLAAAAGMDVESLIPQARQPAPVADQIASDMAPADTGLSDQTASPESRELELWLKSSDGSLTQDEQTELDQIRTQPQQEQTQDGIQQWPDPSSNVATQGIDVQGADVQRSDGDQRREVGEGQRPDSNAEASLPSNGEAVAVRDEGTDSTPLTQDFQPVQEQSNGTQAAQTQQAVAQGSEPQQVQADAAPGITPWPSSAQSVNRAPSRTVPDDLLGMLNASGGISSSIKSDIDQDAKGRPGLYRAAGRNIDEIGALMVEHGYLTPVEAADGNVVLDMLRRAVGGERIMTAQGIERAQQKEDEARHRADLVAKATGLGVNPRGKSIAKLESAIQQEIARRESAFDARQQALIQESADAEQAIEDVLALFGYGSPSFQWMADKFAEISARENADHRKSGYDSLVRAARQALRKWHADNARVEAVIEKSLEDGYGSTENPFGPSEGIAGEAEPSAAAESARPGGVQSSDGRGQGFALETQTEQSLAEKVARENDQSLADKQTADAQRDGFTLSTQQAEESRSEDTADMFGGPSVADFQKTQERDRQQAGRTAADVDLFAQPDVSKKDGNVSTSAEPVQKTAETELVAATAKSKPNQETEASIVAGPDQFGGVTEMVNQEITTQENQPARAESIEKQVETARSEQEGSDTRDYVRLQNFDHPTVGVLNNLRAQKDAAWAAVKKLKAQVRDGRNDLRVKLIQAESAHKDLVRQESSARESVEEAANAQGLTTYKPSRDESNGPMFSREEPRTPPTTDLDGIRSTDISKANKLAMVFSALGKFEDAFQRETPVSTAMEDIAREVMPGAQVRKLNSELPQEWDLTGVPETWEIATKDSPNRVGRFMSDGKHVWIDVSRLLASKDMGSAMYAIAAAYAHNNGQVFIGDPAGLSPIAFFRRLENMISSAIKYGTTDHLMPHTAQMNPETYYAKEYPDFAKAVAGLGLQWKTGDFDSNLKQMLLTSYNAAKRFMPGIEDIEYDFTNGGFRRVSDNARIDRDDLKDLPRKDVGEGSQAGKRYYAGSATAARAILTQSISRSQGSEGWRGVLAALSDQLRGRRLDPDLIDLFYSREQVAREFFGNPDPKSTVEQVTKELAGEGSLGNNIQVIQSALDLPPDERRQVFKASSADIGLEAVFFPESGKTYIIADNIEPGKALAALMHDGGVHAGLYGMLGERGINSLASQIKDWSINSLGKEEGRIAKLALARIPESTSPNHKNEEAVAYFITEAVNAGYGDPKPTRSSAISRWFARLWRMVESAITKLGANPSSLTVDDVVALARGALERVKSGEIDPRRMQNDPMESRSSKYSPEQNEFRKKAGIGARPTIRQKLARWAEGMKDSLSWQAFRQGALDQFYGIKLAEMATIGALPVEQSAYVTARLATGASSVMAGLLGHGQARWAANGQHLEKIPGTKGLLDVLKPVEGQLDDFLGWMVATRAARLMKEGRENNFTDADIQAGLSLADGKEDLFKQVAKDFADFKRGVLDIAEQAGLIDPAGRKVWDHADWIPFYRQMQDDTTKAPGGKRGLSKQSSGIRQLKGGESAINDPLENILLNFQHLIDASLKNNALRKVIGNVEGQGNSSEFLESAGYGMQGALIPRDQIKKQLIAAGTPQQMIDALPAEALFGMAKMWALRAPDGKDIIRVMENGKPHFYRVTDPLLLKAVTSFEPFNIPGLATMRAFKRLLTRSVTATPAFMARNFIRDSASSAIISRDRSAVLGALRGVVKSYTESGGYETMMFAGASFAGGQTDGADPESTAKAMRRELRKKGFSAASADEFMASILDKPIKLWDAYSQIGEAIENANREAMYEAAKRSGKSDTAASFEALDLMDFRLRGSHAAYQMFADIIPFVNARIQGMYRLGRSDMKQVAVRGGLFLMIPSVLLALANAGNDEYEELPDWDKDTYWHFFVGGRHFRLPKPFEVGVMFGTIPERITRAALGNDSPKKLASRVWFNIAEQFNLVQWPQFMKPAIEVAMNEDGFSRRPIETIGDKAMIPSMRASYYTSDTMKALAGLMPGMSDATGMSPKRLQHLWNGYLGSVGSAVLGLADVGVRKVQGQPARESMRKDEYPLLGIFYRENPAKNSKYVEEIYKMAQESAELKKSFDAARKAQNKERADEILADNKDKIKSAEMLGHAAASMSSSSKKIEAIRKNAELTQDQKREQIDAVIKRRNEIAEKVAKRAITAWGGAI